MIQLSPEITYLSRLEGENAMLRGRQRRIQRKKVRRRQRIERITEFLCSVTFLAFLGFLFYIGG